MKKLLVLSALLSLSAFASPSALSPMEGYRAIESDVTMSELKISLDMT